MLFRSVSWQSVPWQSVRVVLAILDHDNMFVGRTAVRTPISRLLSKSCLACYLGS